MKDGMLIRPFSISEYSSTVPNLIESPKFLSTLASNGKQNVIYFARDRIQSLWKKILENL